MSKTLVVFGATGQQGSSVVDFVLNDPDLSQIYKIRAITRDVSSPKAITLAKKIEVVQGDASDPASLTSALRGAHFVFAMTNTTFASGTTKEEIAEGKAMADAAVAAGAEHLIFSSLPSISKITNGRYPKAIHFEGKAEVADYIRSLDIKSSFVEPGFFLTNFHNFPFMAPKPTETPGTYSISFPLDPSTKIPMIDPVRDTGKYVGAILAQPNKFDGKTFCASTAMYNMEDAAAVLSKAIGKKVVYRRISKEEFKSFLPFAPDAIAEAYFFLAEFGYYGTDSAEKVAWAAANARSRPTTLEEYFELSPLQVA